MPNIDLRKQVRIHEALSDVLSKINLKELSFEVMFFLFAKISKSHKDETVYNLDANEFQRLIGKAPNLSEYKQAVKDLRKITFEIETDDFILIDGIISNAKFIKGKGAMEVKISSDMKPFLLDLVSNYTAPQLYSMLRLNSKHAKRLYLYFNAMRPKKGLIRTVIEEQTITEFKKKTGFINPDTGEEIYKDWNHFNERVLKVAKQEINAVSNIKIAYYPRKWGREVYWIEWHIENKSNEELIQLEEFKEKTAVLDDKSFDQKLQHIGDLGTLTTVYGLTEHQAQTILARVDRNHLFGVVLGSIDKVRKEKPIPKIGGYTVTAIKNAYNIDLTKAKKG